LRKYFAFISLSLIMILLSGCMLVQVNPDRDRAQVLATLNGEEILKGEVLDIYEQQKKSWGITPEIEANPQHQETLLNIKKQILDDLIDERIVENQAKAAGFTVRPEDIEKARADFEQQLRSHAEFLREQDEEAKREGVDYEQRAREFFDRQLEALGMTEQEYIEIVAQRGRIQEFREYKLKDLVATKDDVQKYYDDQLALQQANPAQIDEQEVTLIRQPAARVKHILIALPQQQQDEYQRLMGEGKNDEAEAHLAQSLEGIRPKAQEILQRARAGEDFEELIAEYGEDPGMVDNEEGYVVQKDGRMIPQFEEASLALENVGDISDLVGGQFGYHIIKLYESILGNIYTLDEKTEEIEALLDSRMQETEWNSLMEQWREEAKIERFPNRL